jgi:hypothetical protein
MDPNGGYYRNIAVNASFVSKFSATDARKAQFLFWGNVPGYPALVYQTRKYRTRVVGSITGDIVIMRSAEMYLIEAEALAHQDKVSESIDVLFAIQGLRDTSAVKLPATTSKDDLINAVLLERRKELYGEQGVYFFDLKRYQRPLVRDGNHPYPLNILANDPRWIFQLPIGEIDANPKIEPADQNP